MKIISPKNRKPIFAKRIHRNAKCPCGSGKKAKYCCGARTTYYQKLRRLLKKNLTLDIHLFGVTLLPNQKSWNISFVRVQVNNYISALFSITKDVVHGWWYIDLCFTKKKMKINNNKYVVGK
jgi:hypothetical protein